MDFPEEERGNAETNLEHAPHREGNQQRDRKWLQR
jgi:hypothetical protein